MSSHEASDVNSVDTVAEELQRPPMVGRLSVDNINFGIPSHEGAKDHLRDEYGHESWRYHAMHFLHSTKVQIFLMVLLLLDVLVLFVETFLLGSFPDCSTITRDAISCCPVTNTSVHIEDGEQGSHLFRWLQNSHHEGLCQEGAEPLWDYDAGCDSHKWSTVHRAEEFLFGITVAILSTFLLELTVSIVALKPQIFFRQFFYLMDFVVVSVSLALELTFHFLHEDTLQSLSGLLIAARIWRFIRVGHGIVEVTHIASSKAFHTLLDYTEELEELLRDHDIAVPESQKIKTLKKQLNSSESHGSSGHKT